MIERAYQGVRTPSFSPYDHPSFTLRSSGSPAETLFGKMCYDELGGRSFCAAKTSANSANPPRK
jgi:hypothetical protein